MITNFKIFEDDMSDNLYDEGEYVFLLSDYFLSYERSDSERRGIISDISYHKGDGWQYDILMINHSLEQGVLEYGIERKLTKKEIEQVNLEYETDKYNL